MMLDTKPADSGRCSTHRCDGNYLDYVFSSDIKSSVFYKSIMHYAIDLLQTCNNDAKTYSGATIADIRKLLQDIEMLPQNGTGVMKALRELGKPSVEHALKVSSAAAVAHLHCPVAIPALAAETLISATNQSLDSWDQSPFATLLEERVIQWLLELAGASDQASGCFNSGGSQSNMTALYLAIEQMPEIERKNFVIFTSENAHFSILKSARILGLAADAVIPVPTDENGRMSAAQLHPAIIKSRQDHKVPLAVVATAGTTDLGAIDPLSEIADIAKLHNLWLHVDAAYGGGLLFTPHRDQLKGIERAHSVTIDFHKMLFQPISCGVLLVKDKTFFSPLASKADYLNPEEEVFAHAPNLVERSLQTTRRGDALKVAITMRSVGRDGISEMVCKTLENAKAAAMAIRARDQLELIQNPPLSTVMFRYVPRDSSQCGNRIALKIREQLFNEGTAAIATTVYQGRVCFKLTMLNPFSDAHIVNRILNRIVALAEELQQSPDFAHSQQASA
ncbi:aspartate aminotransferase family protein [Brucella sp. TWI432]